MNAESFEKWLQGYGECWETGNAHAITRFFSADARYYETPFDEPMVGRDAIRRYWEEGAVQAQTNVTFEFYGAAVVGNRGFARWRASFNRVPSGVGVEIAGFLEAAFAEDGLCSSFREWWHRREG
ncbi:MAG: nuclear transport factor 2 family protein [Wenzhouxiangella sp.]|jgi:hypothetical protein|nr:nuclear transport factor 2 family protein [Wenzhouxiangella sp.]